MSTLFNSSDLFKKSSRCPSVTIGRTTFPIGSTGREGESLYPYRGTTRTGVAKCSYALIALKLLEEGKLFVFKNVNDEDLYISYSDPYSDASTRDKRFLVTYKNNKQIISATKGYIKRILMNKSEEKIRHTNGAINLNRYFDRSYSSVRVFDKKKANEIGDICIMLLADESGSTRGGKISAIRDSVTIIAEACAAFNIPCYIMGFSADEQGFDKEAEIRHYTTWKNKKNDRSSIADIQARNNNRDGASIRYATSLKYPEVYRYYKDFCYAVQPTELLGIAYLTKADENLYIANLFGQLDYGTHKRQTDYKALKEALERLDFTLKENEITDAEIRIPYNLGCGLAGGDWETVEETIKDVFENTEFDVQIWKL